MSDQVSIQYDTVFVGAGGGNINTINGDPTPAQTLVSGAGITIIDGGGGVHTFSVTGGGITEINGNGVAHQVIAAGSGINVVSVGGTTTITNAGILTINGGGAPNQLIVAGAGISVMSAAGTTTISATGGGGGIASVNGDVGPAIVLSAGGPYAAFTDLGGGSVQLNIGVFTGAGNEGLVPTGSGHTNDVVLGGAGGWVNAIQSLSSPDISIVVTGGSTPTATVAPGSQASIGFMDGAINVAVPSGVLTSIVTAVPATTGFYVVTGQSGFNAAAGAGTYLFALYINGALANAAFTGDILVTQDDAGCVAWQGQLTVGQPVEIRAIQNSGVGKTSTSTILSGCRLSNN